jgi:hypothetical protein
MIRFVDFEASSLHRGSFPIEVAWVDENGQGESYLIRPADTWLNPPSGMPDWHPASEGLHGISMSTLIQQGVPHDQVARRAVAALAPSHVLACSDAPAFDGQWLRMLLATAGIPRKVQLVDVNHLYGLACRRLLDLVQGDERQRARGEQRVRNLAREIVERAQEAEGLRQRVNHRALPDAESLWRTWRSVQDAVSRQMNEATGQ